VKNWVKKLWGSEKEVAPADAADTELNAVQPAAHLTLDELRLVRKDVRLVLDQHADARRVLRHLGMLEQSLQKKRASVIDDLPVALLRKALEQLQLLTANPADHARPGLALLRSKAAHSIAQRERVTVEREQLRLEAEQARIDAQEATHSDFMQAADQWERSFTGGSLPMGLDDAIKRRGSGSP
jgi:hypothetical protein